MLRHTVNIRLEGTQPDADKVQPCLYPGELRLQMANGGHPVLIRHPQHREQVLHLPLIHRLAPLRSLSSMHEAPRPGQRGLTGL